MKNIVLLTSALLLILSLSRAQNVMQIAGNDCNGNPHDLYADLDAGKAVILHFFMPNCGSCPPPAQKIQAMANHINASHPGMVTAYAMPYNNTTTCAATASWVSSNGLTLYMPYDSGATQVANYGGFGMPTVVLLGGSGANRRVLFSTQSFSTADTTIMRDSILNLIMGPNAVRDLERADMALSVYPNPASDLVKITIDLPVLSDIKIDIADITGKQVAIVADLKQAGFWSKEMNTNSLPSGTYLVRSHVNGQTFIRKFNVLH